MSFTYFQKTKQKLKLNSTADPKTKLKKRKKNNLMKQMQLIRVEFAARKFCN